MCLLCSHEYQARSLCDSEKNKQVKNTFFVCLFPLISLYLTQSSSLSDREGGGCIKQLLNSNHGVYF